MKQSPVSQNLQGFFVCSKVQKNAKKRSLSVDFWWT